MKRFALNVPMTLSLLILPWTATYAVQCQGNHDGMKDVKKEIEKIEDGVIIKITSDNPETVRRIQERAGKHMDEGPCKHEVHRQQHEEGERHS
jgi:TusA-related sulfurtransferase